MNNIVETAVSAGSFKTLVTAVQAAGLEATLMGAGPFTVFAPTDEAFAKLPKGTVEGLLQDKTKLAQVLTYHVVAGKVMAGDVIKLDSAGTFNHDLPCGCPGLGEPGYTKRSKLRDIGSRVNED